MSSFNRGTRTSIESIKYAIESMTENKKGLLALSPLLVFIVLYLVTSIISGDFYKVPITVAFMISSILLSPYQEAIHSQNELRYTAREPAQTT